MPGELLTIAQVHRARHLKCYLDDGRPPVTDEDAAELVDQRGFMALGVLPRLVLPNMSESDPDRDWDISTKAWRWKETLPAARACAYLKWFYNQGTFISWRLYPCFYSLWGLRLRPREAYQEGLLTREELDVLTAVEELGPVTSRDLWRSLKRRLKKRTVLLSALTRLQKVFCVTVSGGDVSGWSMHKWDLVQRHVPDGLLDRLPSREESVRLLILQAVENLVYCSAREIAGLFRWTPSFVMHVLRELEQEGKVSLGVKIEGCQDPYVTRVIF